MFTNAVVDLSHHNKITDFHAIINDGIVGIIHKATEGLSMKDAKYDNRKAKWLDLNMLWGSYHFASKGSGKEQALRFLDVVKPVKGELLVLDYEKSLSGKLMSIDEAEKFVSYIQEQTGIWPGLYSGNDIKEQLGNRKDTPLKNCWLWIAQYGSRATNIPPAWSDWTMWQYTDGSVPSSAAGPKTVNGIGKCDRNFFNGTMAELRVFWGKESISKSEAEIKEEENTSAVDRKYFFDHFPFRPLKAQGVRTIEAIMDHYDNDAKFTNLRQLAYVLATAFHESDATWNPGIREYGRGKKKKYGAIDAETGQAYYGRGLSQITWRFNYERFSGILNVDLVNKPDLALNTENSVKILMIGMRDGIFTNHKLSMYFDHDTTDWNGARKIVNGTDQAQLIAGYAKKFYDALEYKKIEHKAEEEENVIHQ